MQFVVQVVELQVEKHVEMQVEVQLGNRICFLRACVLPTDSPIENMHCVLLLARSAS